MTTARKIFFAIPFDSATRMLYDRICAAVRQKYPGVTTVIGCREVGPSPEYSDIASFKTQNLDLNRQFVRQIEQADLVVADLTHNNPNVHVELGIALGPVRKLPYHFDVAHALVRAASAPLPTLGVACASGCRESLGTARKSVPIAFRTTMVMKMGTRSLRQ